PNIRSIIFFINEWTITEIQERFPFKIEQQELIWTFIIVWRASIGELLGTAFLVFMIDTIVISSFETQTKTPSVLMSILIAITITILLLAVHPISGGCTLTVISPGTNGPLVTGIDTSQAFWLEIICTFIFLFASIWLAYDHRQAKALGIVTVFTIIGIVLGLLVFVSTSLTGKKGYAGAGMNPARCLGPAMIRGGHLWQGHWVFWIGPMIACMAFYIYTKIIPSNHFHAIGYRHDFFNVLRAMV
nr:aquaporin AQPAn.G-like [Tanacetum cinerariifolium]